MQLIRKPKPWLIITVFGIAAIIVIVSSVARTAISTSRQIAEESARRALFTEIVKQLDIYSVAHNAYPAAIIQLNITNYQDGSTASTLSNFQYTSDSISYELKCDSVLQPEQYGIRKAMKKTSSQPVYSIYSDTSSDTLHPEP